jgi:hypothetical protein
MTMQRAVREILKRIGVAANARLQHARRKTRDLTPGKTSFPSPPKFEGDEGESAAKCGNFPLDPAVCIEEAIPYNM